MLAWLILIAVWAIILIAASFLFDSDNPIGQTLFWVGVSALGIVVVAGAIWGSQQWLIYMQAWPFVPS